MEQNDVLETLAKDEDDKKLLQSIISQEEKYKKFDIQITCDFNHIQLCVLPAEIHNIGNSNETEKQGYGSLCRMQIKQN